MNHRSRFYGPFVMLASAAAMGTVGVFVKLLDMPALEVASLRFVLALFIIFAITKSTRIRLHSFDARISTVMGLSGSLAILFYFLAIADVGISLAALLLYTAPIHADILSLLFDRRRPSLGVIAAILVSLTGVCLLLRPSVDYSWGLVFGLLAGLFAGIKFYTTRRLALHDSAWTITFYYMLVGSVIAVFLFIADLAYFHTYVIPSGIDWLYILGLVLISSVVGFMLQHYAFHFLSAPVGSSILITEAVFASLYAVLFFTEMLDPQAILGGVLVLASGAYLTMRRDEG